MHKMIFCVKSIQQLLNLENENRRVVRIHPRIRMQYLHRVLSINNFTKCTLTSSVQQHSNIGTISTTTSITTTTSNTSPRSHQTQQTLSPINQNQKKNYHKKNDSKTKEEPNIKQQTTS